MATKNRSKRPQPIWEVNFLDWRMNADEKKQFAKEYATRGSAMLTDLDSMVLAGYKMSLSFDSNNQTFICSFTCKNEASPNHNWCMTSRAPDAFQAVAMGLFKHFELCHDQIWLIEQDDMKDYG